MNRYTSLKKFLLDRTYKKYEVDSLTYDVRLEKDLGFDGDDAAELIFYYSEKFNVNITEFDLQTYFTPEDSLTYIFFKIFPFINTKKDELTIGDLMAGIKSGVLNDDVIKRYRKLNSYMHRHSTRE